MPGTEFFNWPRPFVTPFLSGVRKVVFVPFAAVTISYDEYTSRVQTVFQELGFEITSLHRSNRPEHTVNQAEAIVVGGGNTFALLDGLYQRKCLTAIRTQVLDGARYVGWSAGANLAGPTIKTTNDMPIVQPESFDALGIVPFQINPHYHELKFEGQGGETRRERLEEFLVLNPDKKVIGLPEGMLLQRSGAALTLKGTGFARLYTPGAPVQDLSTDEDLGHLL